MSLRKCLNCKDSKFKEGVMKCSLTDREVFADCKCVLGREQIREKIACEGNPYYKGK